VTVRRVQFRVSVYDQLGNGFIMRPSEVAVRPVAKSTPKLSKRFVPSALVPTVDHSGVGVLIRRSGPQRLRRGQVFALAVGGVEVGGTHQLF
jgi:hypothetical protein